MSCLYINNKMTFVAEGIETGLSIKDAVKNGDVVVTLGKVNFANIDPHSIGQKVIFCLDNDGAQSFTDGVIHKAAERLIDHGKEVFITIPNQINNAKTDFNDIARIEGINAVGNHLDKVISYEQFSKDFKIENKSVGNNFIDKLIKSRHDFTKQLNNIYETNKEIGANNANKEFKNMEQTNHLKKHYHLQIDKNPQLLNLERHII